MRLGRGGRRVGGVQGRGGEGQRRRPENAETRGACRSEGSEDWRPPSSPNPHPPAQTCSEVPIAALPRGDSAASPPGLGRLHEWGFGGSYWLAQDTVQLQIKADRVLVWFPVNQAGPDHLVQPPPGISAQSPWRSRLGKLGCRSQLGTARRPAPSAPAVMEPSQTPNVPDLQLTSKLPSWNCSLGWIPKGTLWKEAQWCPFDVIAKSRAALKRLAHLASLLLKIKPGLDLLRSCLHPCSPLRLSPLIFLVTWSPWFYPSVTRAESGTPSPASICLK